MYLGLENTSIGNAIALTERQRGSKIKISRERYSKDVSVGDGGSNPPGIAEEILTRNVQNRWETKIPFAMGIVDSEIPPFLVTKDCTACESGGRDRFLFLKSNGPHFRVWPILFAKNWHIC